MNYQTIINHIFPTCCQLCGVQTQATQSLCYACRVDLPSMPTSHCRCCAIPLPQAGLCGQCLKKPPAFQSTVAALRYEHVVEHLVHRCKFHADQVAGLILSEALAQRAQHAIKPDVLIPVPLSKNRLKTRGFNQAWELSRIVSKVVDVKVDFKSVERLAEQVPQSTLHDPRARRRNVKAVFHVKQNRSASCIRNQHIAVIDDVMTSGATANSMARSLLQAGAARVDIWVASRAGLRLRQQ